MRLLPAERVLILLVAVVAFADLILIMAKGISIDWMGYAFPGFGALALMIGGLYYRTHRGEERLAVVLIASGLFIVFTLVASVFNYLLLPIRMTPFDGLLVQVDAIFGYSWPRAVAVAAEWPIISRILFYVYFSSLPQLAFVIVLLGFSGKTNALWHFLLTGFIGVIGSIAIWLVFPTFGPSTLYVLSPDLLSRIELGVTPNYGDELLRLGREGAGYISPRNVLGLIGFPSFHTVMACMSVVFLARIRSIFPFVLIVNVVMLPAILVHGGHHLSDVLGGMAMFGLAYVLAGKVLATLSSEEAEPDAKMPI
ncbi:hypothetical protein GGQ73_003743 [Rhizobium skierniewicense]|uniref:Inositolphosphotransferase Aur1/Ipt1 domain-containing protein n=1 Tax=Rhizobium skierniewicense TaxID=984260 RepID=A0A7W6C8S0_9HYPH|nr:phosphatase PAP2 family protein [Rhizobium skierniewicense]MBB3947772.1 hypothetical protein [Rhizobium skierniewicense]